MRNEGENLCIVETESFVQSEIPAIFYSILELLEYAWPCTRLQFLAYNIRNRTASLTYFEPTEMEISDFATDHGSVSRYSSKGR